MKVQFLDAAKEELKEAKAYYQKQRKGLGLEFAAEVKKAIKRILVSPGAWSRLSANTRRCRTNRFPYGVVYTVRGNELLIVAVMHLHREPGYWQGRLPE